jgi:transposase
VCFSCAEVPTQPLPLTGRETGIDVGLKVFLITADRKIVENPRHYRKAEKQPARAQRRVSRRKKGSKRRRKAVALLKRKHQQVHRHRQDFHHKTALMGVPPAFTSQECSGCGERVLKSLSVRTHVCPSCSLILDRKANAARNIQWRGQRLRGVPTLAGATNREPAGLWPQGSVRLLVGAEGVAYILSIALSLLVLWSHFRFWRHVVYARSVHRRLQLPRRTCGRLRSLL